MTRISHNTPKLPDPAREQLGIADEANNSGGKILKASYEEIDRLTSAFANVQIPVTKPTQESTRTRKVANQFLKKQAPFLPQSALSAHHKRRG